MEANKNIQTLLGDPKKAIRKLALPTILSMLLIMVNNLTDAIFVAGLGGDAIAGLGFITPVFLVIIGIGNAIGAGANSYIARALGERNKMKVNDAATHSIVIGIIVSAILTVVLLLAWKPILGLMGAGSATSPALRYGNFVFLGTIVFILAGVFAGILRSEGDVKRATIVLALTAVINMVLDPILIYVVGWGIEGAAIATVLADVIAIIPMMYWFYVKKDTFIRPSFKGFSVSKKITRGIINVAVPSSAETIIMSCLTIGINTILATVGGVDSVACYTSGMRVVSFMLVPLIGLSTALLTVAGAAYGERNGPKFKEAFKYALKRGVIISVILGIILCVFSGQIALLFSYAPSTAYLTDDISLVLFVFGIIIFFKPFGFIGNTIFQSVGKGTVSLFLTFVRGFLLEIVFTYTFAIILGWGIVGAYIGIGFGNIISAALTYIVSNCYVGKVNKLYGGN